MHVSIKYRTVQEYERDRFRYCIIVSGVILDYVYFVWFVSEICVIISVQ